MPRLSQVARAVLDTGTDRRGAMSWSQMYPPVGSCGMPVIDTMTRYEIQEADAPGDGTVHTGSALYVSGPMTEASGRGVEHDQTFTPARSGRW